MVRDWKGWADVNVQCPESVQRHSIWVGKGGMGQAKFVPTHYSKIGCSDHFIDQIPISTLSDHSLYYLWEIGRVKLIWNGWISPYTLNLGVKCRYTQSRNFHHLFWLKSRGVMTVVEYEFQSPPSQIIHYAYGDTLEGLGCCELHESVSTHTIWVRKVSMGQAKFVPSQSWKIGCGDHFSAHIPISTMSNLSSY